MKISILFTREGIIADRELTTVKGIGPASADKLVQAGITSVRTLIETSTERLAEVTGFGLVRVSSILQAAQDVAADQIERPASLQESLRETPSSAEISEVKKRKKKKKNKKAKGKGKKKANKKKSDKKKKKKAAKKAKKKKKKKSAR